MSDIWAGLNGYRLRPHWVYRAFDGEGRLLYVGCTVDFDQRRAAHRSKPWYPSVTRWETEKHPNFHAGRAAEREAIENEAPLHNVPATVRARRTVETKRRIYDQWPTARRPKITEASA